MKTQKITLFVAMLLGAFGFALAQDTPEADPKPWTLGGSGGITLNQVGLFNWTAGGTSNLTVIGRLNGFANYKKGNHTWDNSLNLGYGILYNNMFSGDKAMRVLTKAEDQIQLTSKWGRKAWGEKAFYSAYLDFLTQFDKGFGELPNEDRTNYISKFFAPAYLKLGFGLDFKPAENLSITVSPLAGKFTFVNDTMLSNAQAFGVNRRRASDPSRYIIGTTEKARGELGASLRIAYRQGFFKKDDVDKLVVDSKVDVFFNYLQMPDETTYDRFPGDSINSGTTNVGWHADVDWQNNITVNVNKYINVTFFTHLLYDGDVVQDLYRPNREVVDENGDATADRGIRVQFKEIFGLGFKYTF